MASYLPTYWYLNKELTALSKAGSPLHADRKVGEVALGLVE